MKVGGRFENNSTGGNLRNRGDQDQSQYCVMLKGTTSDRKRKRTFQDSKKKGKRFLKEA